SLALVRLATNPSTADRRGKRSSSSSESPQKKSGTWKSCVRFFTSTCPPCFAAAYAPNPSSKPRSEERRVGKERRYRRTPCQAEDGIRDRNVTGVQTCALPI